MALTISTNKGTYDMPSDFSIEVENFSPIYSEKGSQTISATLPASKHNLEMIGHINRMDISHAPDKNIAATIADGIYRRTGKQNITSPSIKGGIVSNIGFDESMMYDAWTDVTLKKLPNLPIYKPSGGIAALMDHLSNVMNYTESADYFVFPIQIANETVNDVDYPEYINGTELVWHVYELKKTVRTEQVVEDGKLTSMTVPAGYGISPFLKVSKILELIFSAYGYTLIENPFSTHYQLKKMVVLNNVKDTIVEGFINYKDLMPDCTINEFLDSIYCRTGAKIYVNGDTKTARIILLKDSLSASASDDWTLLKSSELVPTFSEPKQIKLSAAASLTGAEATGDNFEEFIDKYNGIATSVEGLSRPALPTNRYLIYQPSTGSFYRTNLVSKTHTLISSDFFPWDKKTPGLDYEEITGNDECVPMAVVPGGFLYPQYFAGAVHNHTTISSSETTSSAKDVSTPLAFCFAMGSLTVNIPNSIATYYFGSSLCRSFDSTRYHDPDGNEYQYSLTFRGEDGAFNRFFKEYDAILRHANHTLEGDVNFDKSQLSKIDTSRSIMISGQKFMIESVKFSLPLKKTKPSTIKLRTTKLLKPYDLSTEQGLVQMKEQLYDWKIVEYSQVDSMAFIAAFFIQAGTSIEKENYKINLIELLSAVEDKDFSAYLPPSYADALAKKEILNKYRLRLTWVHYVGSLGQNGHKDEIDYRAGIQAYTL